MRQVLGVLALAAALAFLAFGKGREEAPLLLTQDRPKVPSISLGKVRDLEAIREFASLLALEAQKEGKEPLSEEEITAILSRTLRALQEKLPFSFPPDYYNVLCIEEPSQTAPFAFEVHKRLYLGETELGFPFYLDVRVVDATPQEEVIAWHVEGAQQSQVWEHDGRYALFGRHTPAPDAGHGFASLQGERKLFFACMPKEGRLYCCYAEGPAALFDKHAPLFEQIIAQL